MHAAHAEELPLPRLPVRLGLRVRRDVHKRLRARLERARAFAGPGQLRVARLLVDDVHRKVLDDLKKNSSASGPVTVQLLRERDLHDEGAVYQNYTAATKTQLEQATRNMDCFVLKGYRIWNWGLELQDLHDLTKFTPVKDCILYDEDYDQQGTFMMNANFSGPKRRRHKFIR